MTTILWVAAGLLAAYWILPELLLHYGRLGVDGPGASTASKVGLTFDDGPGVSTAAILDTLRDHGAKATFFVVAQRAQQHPELVRRMVEEGHEVQAHGLLHRSAWLLGPRASVQQVHAARRILAELTGQDVGRMRPPWGHFNLALAVALWRGHVRPTLWSADPGDWRSSGHRPSGALLHKSRQLCEPGAVLLLHDAGGDGRGRTAAMLPDLLKDLEQRGLQPVTLARLYQEAGHRRSGLARAVLQLWEAWERLFGVIQSVDTLGDGPDSILAIARVHYRGEPAQSDDGVSLRPGDVAAEIHFLSRKMAGLGAVRSATAFVTSLRQLAQMAQTPKYQDVQVYFGHTLMFRLAGRFGFSVRDVRSPWRRLATGIWLRWLMLIYNREGRNRMQRRPQFLSEPKLTMISRQELLRRYGKR